MASVPDPDITRIPFCQDCKSPMGAIRAYEATQAGTQRNRGRIVQTCTNGKCHWTKFHTQDSYEFEDGENLIKRITARELGVVLPPEILNAPLRIAHPLVPPSDLGPLPCRGNCTYQAGGKPRALKTCIELKCKPCCSIAFNEAAAAGKGRAPCKGHHLPSVRAELRPGVAPPTPNPVPTAPTPNPVSTVPTPNPVSTVPTPNPVLTTPIPAHPVNVAQINSQTQPGAGMHPVNSQSQQPSLQNQPPRITPVNTSSNLTAAPGDLSQTAGTAHGSRKKALAQPLGKNWLARKEEAYDFRAKQEDLKSRRSRMDEELKRTVHLLIYLKANVDPIKFACYVDTYPQLKLDSLPLLVDQLNLNERSLFDYWNSGQWEIVTPSSIIFVEKGRVVILRRRPSLIEDIPLTQCPGISTFMTSQLSQPRNLKRAAENTLVSPLKKSGPTSSSSTFANLNTVSLSSAELKSEVLSTSEKGQVTVVNADQLQQTANQCDNDTDFLLLNKGKGQLITRSVYSWDQGWKKINEMIDNNPNLTEATTFPIVFKLKYVKSTVSSYKQVWKKAPEHLKHQYIAYGDTGKGSWRNFSAAVNNYFTTRKGNTESTSARQPQVKTEPQVVFIEDIDNPEPSSTPPELQPDFVQKTGPRTDMSQSDGLQSLDVMVRAHSPALVPQPFPMDVSDALSLVLSPAPTVARLETKPNQDENLEDIENTNPASLCSFCDQPLPTNPSQLLMNMRAELEDKSWEAPSIFNPLHRDAATFQVYIIYCTRHIFESDLLPIAIASGWPLNPDFGKIFDRVCRQYLSLASIVKGSENEFMVTAVEFYGRPTREQGLLGELASNRFRESGAGYYGEPGFRIIMASLRHLFPPQAINLVNIHPVRYEPFLREVLAHEAAVALIQEDLGINREAAIQVFRASCVFGNNMHTGEDKETEAHIQAAVKRASTVTTYSAAQYRLWIASNSPLRIEEWVEQEDTRETTDLPLTNATSDYTHLTQEELEELNLDPDANENDKSDEPVLTIKQEETGETLYSDDFPAIIQGTGKQNDPIDLTFD